MWLIASACLVFQLCFAQENHANLRIIKRFPNTCLNYMMAGVRANGYYSVAGQNGETITVYCDFTSEPGSAWTLVMSWSLANKNLPAFQSQPLTENVPVNEKSPNWVAYRLSNQQMTFMKSKSTHWRATCSFPKFNFDYLDYMRGNFKDFDITTLLGHQQCKNVEYINIRGHAGYHQTVAFWQVRNAYLLHTDSSIRACQFDATSGATPSEDNFGYYGTIDSKFRCTSDLSATTQYWFGGYV